MKSLRVSKFTFTISAVLSLGFIPWAGADAASTTVYPTVFKYSATAMTINGYTVEKPAHIVAIDPFNKKNPQTASFLPIWYLQQMLVDAGVQSTWNGEVLNLKVPYPIAYPTPPKPLALGKDTMAIEENGKVVTYAPQIKYKDAGTAALTTFAPVYYVQKAFGNFSAESSWDGTNLEVNVKFPDGWTVPVLTQSWSPALSANNQAGEFQLFQKVLGLRNGHFYDIAGIDNAIMIGASSTGGGYQNTHYEVALAYSTWGTSTYRASQGHPNRSPESYRIPIISEQLAKFYFGGYWEAFWNYLNGNAVPDKVFTIGDRQVVSVYQVATGMSTVMISFPGKNLNGGPLEYGSPA